VSKINFFHQAKGRKPLQKELAAVKEERDYLKKMIDILAMKGKG
jgi:hypothetical protein